MMEKISFAIDDIDLLANQLCRWCSRESFSIVLNSNSNQTLCSAYSRFSRYQLLAAFGDEKLVTPCENYFNALKGLIAEPDWLFGYLSYDLKNDIELLTSKNFDGLNFPEIVFFRPSVVFAVQNSILTIHYSSAKYSKKKVVELFEMILSEPTIDINSSNKIETQSRYTKDEYIDTISKILKHIQRGDIYEMNFCQEFYALNCSINPYETFINLNRISPTPFAAFGRFNDKFLLCASPERFLQKNGSIVVTQPIKGTCRRGSTSLEDVELASKLKSDSKERAENTMIVDLVRNDLSRVAQRASVKVDELCGIYPFQYVHQMISTVSCIINPEFDSVDLLKATFPMGSMTGAPKVRAMQIIEQYERTKRGLYSGAVGYFDPEGNFDFNVVIRSLLYDNSSNYLSFTVGGAITSGSNPEMEFEECLLKAKAINQVLGYEEKI